MKQVTAWLLDRNPESFIRLYGSKKPGTVPIILPADFLVQYQAAWKTLNNAEIELINFMDAQGI